jgi:RsiW-degrading membrane proteinase PrsW (M82 family)
MSSLSPISSVTDFVPIEEFTKLVPLLLLFRLTKGRVFTGSRMGPADFAVVGLAAGLGFELVEDMFAVKYHVSHLVFDESAD